MTTGWTSATTSSTTATIKGGLLWLEKDSLAGYMLIPFVGTDPDAKVNVFTWDPDYSNDPDVDGNAQQKKDWTCADAKIDFANQQEPVHAGQYCPHGVKSKNENERRVHII